MLISLVLFLTLNPIRILNYVFLSTPERDAKINNASVYKNLKARLPQEVRVVMNMPSFDDIDVMFYNNDLSAYHWTLDSLAIEKLKVDQVPIAVFKPHGNYNLPSYIYNYTYLFIINDTLSSSF